MNSRRMRSVCREVGQIPAVRSVILNPCALYLWICLRTYYSAVLFMGSGMCCFMLGVDADAFFSEVGIHMLGKALLFI